MAWRTGAVLFSEVWPLIAARVKPDEFRQEFTERLLAYFLECDVDPADLAGLHPEVDRALQRLAELEGEDDVFRPLDEPS
jgi:hypothetical protein